MKKLLLLSFLLLMVFSCQQKTDEKSDQPVILSGTVKGAPVPAIILKDVSNKPVDTLKLDAQGDFTDTLKLAEAYYKITVGPQYTWAYFKPGDEVQINIDFKDFDKSLTYAGKGAERNNYLAQRMLKGIALRPKTAYQYYGNLDEKDFLALQDSIENVYNESLKNLKDDHFVAKEKFRNKIQKASVISKYPMVRAYLTHQPDFKPSADFPKSFDGIDINDKRFSQVPNGAQIVSEYLTFMIGEAQPGKDVDPYQRLQAIDTVLTNPDLKEQLAVQEAKYNLMYTKNLEQFYRLFDKIVTNPDLKKPIKEKYDNIKAMLPGAPSPDFTAYDINGKEYHLKDFAGKPLYIDLWATWCAPCRAEIPYLEKLKEKYKDQPINFLSLDVYDKKDKWEQMVKQQKMEGWQLISTDREMPFLKKYVVDGIPRFILLDAEGKIIDANAPRPSDKHLADLIDKTLSK